MPDILSQTMVSPKGRFDPGYEHCAQRGVHYATAILRNRADAEEAVQETFYRLHRAASEPSDPLYEGKFFKTLRNHCIDLIRQHKVRKEVAIDKEVTGSNPQGAMNLAEANELTTAVERAIQELPEDWRHVLLLKVHGQLSYDEISSATGFSIGQVRTWIYRSRRQLESSLAKTGLVSEHSPTDRTQTRNKNHE